MMTFDIDFPTLNARDADGAFDGMKSSRIGKIIFAEACRGRDEVATRPARTPRPLSLRTAMGRDTARCRQQLITEFSSPAANTYGRKEARRNLSHFTMIKFSRSLRFNSEVKRDYRNSAQMSARRYRAFDASIRTGLTVPKALYIILPHSQTDRWLFHYFDDAGCCC